MEDRGGKVLFSTEVADNLPFAMRIMVLVYLLIGCLGIYLMRPPTEKKEVLLAAE